MTSWVRNPENNRLFRSEPDPEIELTPESEPKPRIEEMAQEKFLSDIFYPPRTALPSRFNISDLGPNVTFKLRPHSTQILPKFTSLENAYLFLREFEEVYSMMHFPNIPIDVVRMKLIPVAKHWMYGLAPNSVASRNDFVRLFLRKYFPNTKTVKLRNEINQFVQLNRESF